LKLMPKYLTTFLDINKKIEMKLKLKLKHNPNTKTFFEILGEVTADRHRPFNPIIKTPYLQLMNGFFKEDFLEILPSKMNYQ
jgi:hypothetical protein